MSVDAALVLTTVGSEADAMTLGRSLVRARLAACVSVVKGLSSIYRWEGEVVEDGECLLLIKAPLDALAALREAILAEHPYQVPELLVIDAGGVPEPYARWLVESTEIPTGR